MAILIMLGVIYDSSPSWEHTRKNIQDAYIYWGFKFISILSTGMNQDALRHIGRSLGISYKYLE